MKKFLCVCLAMLVLLCGTALAENFRCELPDGEWLGDTAPLREGDALLLAGGKALYRVSLADGSAEKLADMPDNVMHPVLRRDAEGQLTLTGIGYDADWNELLVTYTLNADNAWELTSRWDVREALDDESSGVGDLLVSDKAIYLTLRVEGKPQQLIYENLETSEVRQIGSFSDEEWSEVKLFLRGDTLCNPEGDYDKQTLTLHTFDPATGKVGKETYTSKTVPLWTADDLRYVNGCYYALMYDDNVRGLYSGETLEAMTCIASPLTTMDSILLVTDDDVLLANGTLLMSSRIVSEASVTLVLSQTEARNAAYYTMQNGVNFRSVYDLTTADILNTKNSDVDILCITPFDTVSLKLLKDKGYFTDLSSSAILSKQVSRLYPGLQKGLTTDDGKIIGWYETVETYLPDAAMDVLEQNGMTFANTLLEMFQQITQLADEGVFADEGMAPLGYPGYSRLNMLNMSIERYLNEQQLLGNRITLNNAELQELLSYIVANVPADEDAFPENEDGYSLYEMDVSMPITTDCHMPMKVGTSSPAAIPASVYVLVVNPYSQHKEEAICYLEYCAQNVYDETQYRIFADMTEPLVNTYQLERIAELESQIAVLEAQEQTAEVKEQLTELRASKAEAEKYRNIIDVEDIAAWKQVSGNIVVSEENYFTADLQRLVERLSTGNLTVEAFTQEGNRYFEMVYQERGE